VAFAVLGWIVDHNYGALLSEFKADYGYIYSKSIITGQPTESSVLPLISRAYAPVKEHEHTMVEFCGIVIPKNRKEIPKVLP